MLFLLNYNQESMEEDTILYSHFFQLHSPFHYYGVFWHYPLPIHYFCWDKNSLKVAMKIKIIKIRYLNIKISNYKWVHKYEYERDIRLHKRENKIKKYLQLEIK